MGEPSYYPELNRPLPEDGVGELTHKIAGSLYNLSGEGSTLAEQQLQTSLLLDIKDNTENIKLEADSINLNTDTLETLIGSTNTKLDTLHADVDGVESLVTTSNNSLSSIDSKLTSPLTTKITDGAGVVNTKQLGTQLTGTEVGLVTNTIIHGYCTTHGGEYVDVKVNHAGALLVEADIAASVLPTGASTSANQVTANGYLQQLAAVRAPAVAFNIAGRHKTADPVKVFDGRIDGTKNDLVFDQLGSGTFTQINNYMQMSVTSGQYCIWKSHRYMPYYSGSPTTIEETFFKFSPQADLLKRGGYYSSNTVAPYQSDFDGFFIESGGGTIKFFVYNFGSAIVNGLPITSWTGYANLGEYQNLATWDNFSVIEWEFLWLGGAALQLKLKTAAGWVVAHQYDYAGTQEGTMLRHASQPLRFEIVSSTGSGTFTYVCSQCSTDGEVSGTGYRRIHNTGPTAIQCTSIGTTYPIKGIRINSANRHLVAEIIDYSLFVGSTADIGYVSVQLNPTLSAPLTWTNVGKSGLQEARGDGTITVTSPGPMIAGGYLTANSIMPSGTLTENFLAWLGMSIANVSDEAILCFTPSTATVNTYGTLSTEER